LADICTHLPPGHSENDYEIVQDSGNRVHVDSSRSTVTTTDCMLRVQFPAGTQIFPFSYTVSTPTTGLSILSSGEPGSSVSIVSGYGLDDRAIEVRFPAEVKDFSSSLCVQTGSGAHLASCTMGTEDPFPGAKAQPGRDYHLVPRSRMSRSYIASPPKRLRVV
jgi:hypothetical protein